MPQPYYDRSNLSPPTREPRPQQMKKRPPKAATIVNRWLARSKDWRPLPEVMREAAGP